MLTEDELLEAKKREALKGIGEAYFGESWRAQLADAIGISRQHLGGIASGKHPVSPALMKKVSDWTKKVGLPSMAERYKRLNRFSIELSILEAHSSQSFDLDNEAPEPRM